MDWVGMLLALLAAAAAGVFSYRMAAARAGALLAQARQDAETQLAAHRKESAALQAAHESERQCQSAAHREELLALQASMDERMAEMQRTLSDRLEAGEQALALRLAQMEQQRADDFEKLGAIIERKTARAEKAGPVEKTGVGGERPGAAARSLEELLQQAAESPKKAAEAYRTWGKLAGGLKKVKDAFTGGKDTGPPDGEDAG